jgi:hypothetical protein
MLRILNTESVFSFLVPFVTSGFNAWCQNQKRAQIAASEIESFCQEIGIPLIPFSSPHPTYHVVAVARRSGWLKDVRLWRLENTVNQLPSNKKNQLIITVWLRQYTEKGAPLVQAKKEFTLDKHSANRLRQCFKFSRKALKPVPFSGSEVFNLITEQALVSAKNQDRYAFQKWLDVFISLMETAKKHDLDALPDFADRVLSDLIEEISRNEDKVIVSTLSYWLYRQALEAFRQNDDFAFRDYIQLLQWQFRCSLFANNEFGTSRAVYYLLSLGQDRARALKGVSGKKQLQNCLQQLKMLLGIMRKLLGHTLENGNPDLVRELRSEINELVNMTMYELTTQPREELSDAIDAVYSELAAHLHAVNYYIGAWAIGNFLDGRVGTELACASLELATASFKSPDTLVKSLEQIYRYELWVEHESFKKQNLLSPLPKTRLIDERSPFLRFYIVGGLKLAWSTEVWPSDPSPVIRELLPTIEALCEDVRENKERWHGLIPHISPESLDIFLEAQRLMAKRAEDEESRRIEEAELVEDTVQRFVEQCVTSFRRTSLFFNLFTKLSPDRIQKSRELSPDKVLSGHFDKEPFTRSGEPPISGAGELWAEWNDKLCLQSIYSRPSGSIENIEALITQMGNTETAVEVILVSPVIRKYYAGLSEFRPATVEEKNQFGERLDLAGLWRGIPVFRTHLVPKDEVWLMNLSGTLRLIEYTEAKAQVELAANRPLKVLMRFPQRIQLIIEHSMGLRCLKSEGIS